MLIDVVNGKVTMEQFLAQLTNGQLIDLLCGQPNTGVANTFGMGNLPEYGVPNLMNGRRTGRRANPAFHGCMYHGMALCNAAGMLLESGYRL